MRTAPWGIKSPGLSAPITVPRGDPEAGAAQPPLLPQRAAIICRRWRGLAMTGALAALGLACTASTTGPEVLDALVAVSVDGRALPATVVDWPDHHLELLADTIRFRGERYAHRRIERFTGIMGVPEIRETGTEGSVRVEGRSITLEPSCDALYCVEIVLLRLGSRYWARWAPVDGVEVVVQYRPLTDAAHPDT